MASEPERPIEKLLRDAARKRRDEAPAAFELHPATRRLLQGEVTRQYPRQERSAGSALAWLRNLSPGLRWGLASAVGVLIALVVVIPALFQRSDQQLLARNELSKSSTTTPATVPTAPAERSLSSTPAPALALTRQREPQISQRPGMRFDSAATKTDLASFAAAAASLASAKTEENPAFPQGTNGSAAVFQEKSLSLAAPVVASDANAPVLSNTASALQATAPPAMLAGAAQNPAAPPPLREMAPPAAAPATPPLQSFNVETAANSLPTNLQLVQRFVRTSPTKTYSAQNSHALEQRLLVSFSVEQNGPELRVKDEDGSVYLGYLQPAQAVALRDSLGAVAQTAPAAKTTARKQVNAPVSAMNSLPTQAQNYFFRVSGTNLTLKLPVLFTGSISNPAPLGFTQAPLSGARISGRVRVGAQREFEVLASPAAADSKTGDGR